MMPVLLASHFPCRVGQFSVMRAWTVHAEVHFMEPQNINPGESPEDFANRVRLMIATRAGLKVVDWDGMLKYKGVSMKVSLPPAVRHLSDIA
jgi:hypothetical protein